MCKAAIPIDESGVYIHMVFAGDAIRDIITEIRTYIEEREDDDPWTRKQVLSLLEGVSLDIDERFVYWETLKKREA